MFKKRVKRVIDATAEKKYLDKSTTTSFTNVGTFFSPLGTADITQGTSNVAQRVGNELRVRSLRISFSFQALNAFDVVTGVRLIVGMWNDYQVSSPSTVNILANASTMFDISPYQREVLQSRRWTPMYDRHFLMSKNTDDYYPSFKYVNLKFSGKKLPKKRVAFQAGGSVPDHSYFVLIMSNNASGTPPGVVIYSRLTYTDV